MAANKRASDSTPWSAVLRHYDANHRTNESGQLEWFRSQPTLESAVRNAALAQDHRGKRYSHQTRIRRSSLKEGHRRLADRISAISNVGEFDALLLLVSDTVKGVGGLGELWRYDTALRIGAKLGVLPTRVYLHAGTRVGAKRLGLDASGRAVELPLLPAPLRGLPPHEIEDVLCIYKDWIRGVAR